VCYDMYTEVKRAPHLYVEEHDLLYTPHLDGHVLQNTPHTVADKIVHCYPGHILSGCYTAQ